MILLWKMMMIITVFGGSAMKKIIIAVAALALCACAKEEIAKDANLIELSFELSVDESTKTSLNGNDVVWNAGDEIAIFAGTEKVVASIPAAGASATLTVLVPEVETYYAVYPASEANTFDPASATFHLNIPAVQKATAGSFADKANLSVAKTSREDLHLTFRNVLTAVKFQVSADVRQVAFYGNTVESLAGTAVVDYSGESVAVSAEDGAASKFVIVKGPFQAGSSYYATLLANEFTNGITVHVAKGNGVIGVLASNSLTLQRSHSLNLGDLCTLVESRNGWQDLSAVGSYKVKEANMWLNKDYADSLYARQALSLEPGLRRLMTNDESVVLLDINVPTKQNFRLVVNRMIPEVRYYDEANDLKPFNISFYSNGDEAAGTLVQTGNITKLFGYGDGGWNGFNCGIDNVSAVDPQIIVKKNEWGYGRRINFPLFRASEFTNLGYSLNVSNCYTFGPLNDDWVNHSHQFSEGKAVPVLCGDWFPCQGGAAGDKLGGPRGTYFYCVTDMDTFTKQNFIGLVVDIRHMRILMLPTQIKY